MNPETKFYIFYTEISSHCDEVCKILETNLKNFKRFDVTKNRNKKILTNKIKDSKIIPDELVYPQVCHGNQYIGGFNDLKKYLGAQTIQQFIMSNFDIENKDGMIKEVYIQDNITQDNVEEVYTSFVEKIKEIDSRNTPWKICISLPYVENITKLFPKKLRNLQSIIFKDCPKIDKLYSNFLSNCKNLISVDFSGLQNLTVIGDYCLYDCKNLRVVDFSGLHNLQKIGDDFLSHCETLESLDLSGLQNLQEFGSGCLSVNAELKSMKLGNLNQLKSVGNHFLQTNDNLESIDFSGLQSLTVIGDYCLFDCRNLAVVDFSGLQNLQQIGKGTLSRNESLETIKFGNLTNLKMIDNQFIYRCRNLKSVDFSGLKNLKTIGRWFLADCESLQIVNMSGLKELRSIGENWLTNCPNLTLLDISGFSKLETFDVFPEELKIENIKGLNERLKHHFILQGRDEKVCTCFKDENVFKGTCFSILEHDYMKVNDTDTDTKVIVFNYHQIVYVVCYTIEDLRLTIQNNSRQDRYGDEGKKFTSISDPNGVNHWLPYEDIKSMIRSNLKFFKIEKPTNATQIERTWSIRTDEGFVGGSSIHGQEGTNITVSTLMCIRPEEIKRNEQSQSDQQSKRP